MVNYCWECCTTGYEPVRLRLETSPPHTPNYDGPKIPANPHRIQLHILEDLHQGVLHAAWLIQVPQAYHSSCQPSTTWCLQIKTCWIWSFLAWICKRSGWRGLILKGRELKEIIGEDTSRSLVILRGTPWGLLSNKWLLAGSEWLPTIWPTATSVRHNWLGWSRPPRFFSGSDWGRRALTYSELGQDEEGDLLHLLEEVRLCFILRTWWF